MLLKDYYQFARTNTHFLSFGLLTAFFGNFGQTFFIAWFGSAIQNEFKLSSGEYGSLYSLATLTSGLIILYAGALLDKMAIQRFTFLTSLGLFFGCLLMYFAHQNWQLVLAFFLLRFCGQGLMFHIAFTSMARYFNINRGKAIGIVGFGMPLGEVILPALAVTLISQLGWRQSWLILALLIVVIYWPFFWYLLACSKERLSRTEPNQTNTITHSPLSWTRSQVVKDFRFWMILPAIMAPAFIITGIFIHQGELLLHKQWSEQWFATCFIIYGVFHLKSSFVTGSLVDRFGGQRLIRFYLLPFLTAIILLALPINSEIIAAIFMALAGVTIGASGPIVGSLWVELYGHQHLGAIRSMVTSIMVFSTAISPILMGSLFDHHYHYSQVMLLLNGYLIIGLILLWIAIKKFSSHHQQERTQ